MLNYESLNEFIKRSPTPYHATNTVKQILMENGYTELSEGEVPAFSDGGKHFTVRGGGSLIAFHGKGEGFMISASHTDTPCFKVKCDVKTGGYTKLSTEVYGGPVLSSWLDTPLSVAGRVVFKCDGGVECALFDLGRPVATIPSVAPHLNKGNSDTAKLNAAVDMQPLFSVSDNTSLLALTADKLGISAESIISHDLFLYCADEGVNVGSEGELFLSPRLDDLSGVYTALRGFLSAESSESVCVLALFDNEEVGSSTKQGANSTFLADTLSKIAGDTSTYHKMLTSSLMVSLDNAHAQHPNHPELSDTANLSKLSGGVVIKYNANQKYTTDAISDGVFRCIAERAGVRIQSYSNRADMSGGSTLGSIATTKVSVMSVDAGLPQLAMHSARELISLLDLQDMIHLMRELYSSSIERRGEKIIINSKGSL